MITHARIQINNATPTRVTPDNDGLRTNCTIQIQNLGEGAIYIGGADISAISYGCSLPSGSTLTIDELPPLDEVYAMSVDATSYVGILKVIR